MWSSERRTNWTTDDWVTKCWTTWEFHDRVKKLNQIIIILASAASTLTLQDAMLSQFGNTATESWSSSHQIHPSLVCYGEWHGSSVREKAYPESVGWDCQAKQSLKWIHIWQCCKQKGCCFVLTRSIFTTRVFAFHLFCILLSISIIVSCCKCLNRSPWLVTEARLLFEVRLVLVHPHYSKLMAGNM